MSNLDNEARQAGADTMRQKAIQDYQSVAFTAGMLRESGMSFRDIAAKLNQNGFKTRQGKEFKAMTVKRMLDRVQ